MDWTSDWATAYFGASFDNYYFGASPLEDPQRYVQKSPFYKLDRVRTPTIIFFGGERFDSRTEPGLDALSGATTIGQDRREVRDVSRRRPFAPQAVTSAKKDQRESLRRSTNIYSRPISRRTRR